MYQGQASRQQAEKAMRIMREKYGLDKPWYIRFFYYVGNILRGDLGISIRTRRPVWEELKDRYVSTMILTGASLVIAIIVGVGSGIVSAYYKDTFLDVIGQAIGHHRYLIVVYLGVMILGLRWLIKKAKDLTQINQVCNLISLILVAYPIIQIVGEARFELRDEETASVLLSQAEPLKMPEGQRPPDIYYIILDTYTRADWLQSFFDFDNVLCAYWNYYRSNIFNQA